MENVVKPKSIEPLLEMDMNSSSRNDSYYQIIVNHAPSDKIAFLEVGVFKGGLYKYITSVLSPRIEKYVGVDPYLGDERDPYLIGYWQGKKSNADLAHETTKALVEAKHGPLLREMSTDFFARNTETFDVVIIDGDHRAEPAYLDLVAGWKAVKPGGLMLLDDFANPEHTGVAQAAKRFDSDVAQPDGAVTGCRFSFFEKVSIKRRLPFPLGVAYWIKPVAQATEAVE